MRDVALMARTLRAIRDLGGGVARQPDTAPPGMAWFAGASALNDQAVRDLIDDGWLRCPPGRKLARIDAWPSFADQTEASDAG